MKKTAKRNQEPRSLELPYTALEGGNIASQKLFCKYSNLFEAKSAIGFMEYNMNVV